MFSSTNFVSWSKGKTFSIADKSHGHGKGFLKVGLTSQQHAFVCEDEKLST